jgi:hypothetical protein
MPPAAKSLHRFGQSQFACPKRVHTRMGEVTDFKGRGQPCPSGILEKLLKRADMAYSCPRSFRQNRNQPRGRALSGVSWIAESQEKI